MSFRNYGFNEQANIKIEEEGPSQLFLSSKFPPNGAAPPQNQEVLNKIAELVVALHENCLSKCENLQIYRDLNPQEQELLLKADKSTVLHTALAGIMAIDSCLKSMEREEKFVVGNLLRASSTLISTYRKLEKDTRGNSSLSQHIEGINDAIKFMIQQLQSWPACKGREGELEKYLALLDNNQGEEWLQGQQVALVSELQKENDLLKLGIREKDGYIKSLEGLVERGSRLQKKQERKTAHSMRIRMQTEKSSEGETSSQASLQQVYEELNRVKEEVVEKNSIIVRMNEQFASEMDKYNSVFKTLEEESSMLKKYHDIDTVFLLEELEVEIESLKEQRHKDQMIINDIQRRFEGFSFSRGLGQGQRGHQHTKSQQFLQYPQYENGYQQQQQPYTQRQAPYNERREKLPNKYYSPNYASRLSPYDRAPSYREDSFQPAETARSRVSRREDNRIKSRVRYPGGVQDSRERYGAVQDSRERGPLEHKSSPTINLLERVMAKGL